LFRYKQCIPLGFRFASQFVDALQSAISPTMDSFLDAMRGAVHGNALLTAGSGALFGVMFHLAIQPIELELYMFHFMAAYAVTFALSVYTLGFTTPFLFAATFNTGLLGSIAFYRLVLHRCRKFPGPVAAKLTRFYAASLSAKNVQYYKELASLHAQYGDFVRTGKQTFTITTVRSEC
jgi:hypothetical protein